MNNYYDILVREFPKVTEDECASLSEQIDKLNPEQKEEYINIMNYLDEKFVCKDVLGTVNPSNEQIYKAAVVAYKIASGKIIKENKKPLVNSLDSILF